LLEERSGSPSVRLEPLRPLDALASLAAGAGLGVLMQGMNRGAIYLEQCRRVLTQASGWRIFRARCFDELPGVARFIEELAAEDPLRTHAGGGRLA
jgi:hypothetical protein